MTGRNVLTSAPTSALVAMLVTGCGQGTSVTPAPVERDSPPRDETPVVDPSEKDAGTAALPPALPYRQAGLHFPHGSEPARSYPTALGGGMLFARDGCNLLGARDDSPVVVWPYGYSPCRRGGGVLVLNRKGKVEARVGDEVRIGAGELTREGAGSTTEAARRNFEEARREAGVPDGCRGFLWTASPGVRVMGKG